MGFHQRRFNAADGTAAGSAQLDTATTRPATHTRRHAATATLTGNDDAGRRLAAHFLQLLDGILHCFLGFGTEFLRSFAQARSLDLEIDRQRPRRRHQRGLADIEHRTTGIVAAVGRDGRQALDGAHPAIGELLLTIEVGHLHADVVGSQFAHGCPHLLAAVRGGV